MSAATTAAPMLLDLNPYDPDYFWAAGRNLLTMFEGTIAVIMLTAIIYNNPDMFRQYKLTVVFLTYGGWLLQLPILFANIFEIIVIPLRPQFLISTLACSLYKQFCAATMNSSFAISCAIALLRYVLVTNGKEFTLKTLIVIYWVLSAPLYIYFVLAFFVGSISVNDECPYFMEIDWEYRPVLYFGYLALIIILTDFCNIRTLLFLLDHRRRMRKQGMDASNNEAFSKKERDQLHLSIGLVVQSATVSVTFGSTILFMLLFSYGVTVPDWLSTITNTMSSLSTLLNPLAAAIFIRPFRREMLRTLTCGSRVIINDVMGPPSSVTKISPFLVQPHTPGRIIKWKLSSKKPTADY